MLVLVLDGGQVGSSPTSPIRVECPLCPSNTKWVSYRPVAQKNWTFPRQQIIWSTGDWTKCVFLEWYVCLLKNQGLSDREIQLKAVFSGGVEEAEKGQGGWGVWVGGGGRECQGRTIFWLTRLELELPRGITAPDLSASSVTLQSPSFSKKINSQKFNLNIIIDKLPIGTILGCWNQS